MPENHYDPARVLARAREWRLKAQAAATSDMRAFCLEEASRCEKIVQQSLETPAVIEAGPAPGRSFRWLARRADAVLAKTAPAAGSTAGHAGGNPNSRAANQSTRPGQNAVALAGNDPVVAQETTTATSDTDATI
jgi:hypothetical protein